MPSQLKTNVIFQATIILEMQTSLKYIIIIVILSKWSDVHSLSTFQAPMVSRNTFWIKFNPCPAELFASIFHSFEAGIAKSISSYLYWID